MNLRAARLVVMHVSRQQEASVKNSQQFVQNAVALLKFPSSPVKIDLFTAANASTRKKKQRLNYL